MNFPLSHRLQQARERLFVGRAAQLDEFARALCRQNWPFAVWHLHGLGGIGKTTLLREWKRLAQEAGALVISLDGRDFEPNAGAFCQALRAAIAELGFAEAAPEGAATPRALCEALSRAPGRVVLQIDTLEVLAPLDHFWREEFLPRLPSNTALMLAGRDELSLGWRGDAALWSEVASFNLAALSPAESQKYLEKRGIEAPFQEQLLGWTHGHPLALSLAADVWQQHAKSRGEAEEEGGKGEGEEGKKGRILDGALGKGGVESGAQRDFKSGFNSSVVDLSNGGLLSGGLLNGAAREAVAEGAMGGAALLPDDLPPLVGPLLEHLLRAVPTPAHRAALEVCAIVRVLTEEFLAEMLADSPGDEAKHGSGAPPDFRAIFEWLRGLSVVQNQRFGLFPHDIARELLVADLRFRAPEWHVELHRRAREHYLRRIQNQRGAAQERAILDCIYLHRLSPVVAPYLRWSDTGLALESARPDDFAALLEMVERHEGAASRAIAAACFEAQPEGAIVVRGAGGEVQGFVFQLALERAPEAIFELDEGARRAREVLRAQAPLRGAGPNAGSNRARETATLFRFWMDRVAYQNVGATQSLIFVQAVRHYIVTPQLAFTFFACAAPDFWRDGFAYADLERFPAADFAIAGREFGTFGHDWRARPVAEWLDLLSQREMQSVVPAPAASAPVPAVAPAENFVVLDEEQWVAAARQALRSGDNAALCGNVLLGTALVQRRARQISRERGVGEGAHAGAAPSLDERIHALRVLLNEAVAALGAAPRLARECRALELCFVREALTQNAAAAAMDISHSSLRRFLNGALVFVGRWLWERDNGFDAGAAK